MEVGRYFERGDGGIERWIFSAAPAEVKRGLRPFEAPAFHRTVAEWLNGVLRTGFAIEAVSEPKADDATARRVPAVADTHVAAYFLHLRRRKER